MKSLMSQQFSDWEFDTSILFLTLYNNIYQQCNVMYNTDNTVFDFFPTSQYKHRNCQNAP